MGKDMNMCDTLVPDLNYDDDYYIRASKIHIGDVIYIDKSIIAGNINEFIGLRYDCKLIKIKENMSQELYGKFVIKRKVYSKNDNRKWWQIWKKRKLVVGYEIKCVEI